MNKINLSRQELIALSIKNEDTFLSSDGALCSYTGSNTGRAAKDKYIVRDTQTTDIVDWSSNQEITSDKFDKIYHRVLAHLQDKDQYIQSLSSGGEVKLNFNLITTSARAAAFGTNMFYETKAMNNAFKVYHVPNFNTEPDIDGVRSDVCIAMDFTKQIILICGTSYLGEIKKSLFTTLNFILPGLGILPMHASVNESLDHTNSCIFFGLSGTGKTSLSSSLDRILIGDDEAGWGKSIFNFENGCYAKTINLSKEDEPQIYKAVNKFGSILENVDTNKKELDFNSTKFSDNGRASYRLSDIENSSITRKAIVPKNIVMLSYDMYGVLPPVSKLTPEQAHYFFLSGYTSRVAGTEAGVNEPTAVFSTCFGAPFMPLQPKVYADLLYSKIKEHNCSVYLVNTGLQGGGYGVGKRISIKDTRKIIDLILDGTFENCPTDSNNTFSLQIPMINSNLVLNPELSWEDKDLFDQESLKLLKKFKINFAKFTKSNKFDFNIL